MTLIRTVGLILSTFYLMLSIVAARHASGAGRRLSGAAITACAFALFAFVVPVDTLIGVTILGIATALLMGAATVIRNHLGDLARGTFAAYRADDRAVADRQRDHP
jgi:hypothetical protein